MKNQHVSLGQMERREARSLGRRKYFTGRPCRNGHLAERHTQSATCVECLAEYQAKLKACNTLADKLLMQGKLSKAKAELLGSVWYCEGWGLPQCGHLAWQRVIDDRCKACLDQEEAEIRQLLA